jgi:anti-sigma regulatory factor (Ser/Thr protein kinase)
VSEILPVRGNVYRVRFNATLPEVSRVCGEVAILAAARAGPEWSAQVDLGLTEALSNVVRHGYAKKRAGLITLDCVETPVEWLLGVDDHGTPIPAERLAKPEGTLFDFDPQDVHRIPEGGMGLALIRRCFDRLEYHAGLDGNRMVLAKRLPVPARAPRSP